MGKYLLSDFVAKEVACAAGADGPLCLNVLGVGPHKVAEGALVGNLARAVNHADLETRREEVCL